LFKKYPTKNAKVIWTGQVQSTDNIYGKTTHLCKQKVQCTEILQPAKIFRCSAP